MKSIVRFGLGASAGVVAGRIIFGMSREYCSNGFITGVGTAALTVVAFVYVYSYTTGMFDGAFGLKDKENEEEEDG